MPMPTLSRWSRDNPGSAEGSSGCQLTPSKGVGRSRQTVSQAAQYHGFMSGSLGLMAPLAAWVHGPAPAHDLAGSAISVLAS
jgi:hypothetical protein